jgi:hypothetical protein
MRSAFPVARNANPDQGSKGLPVNFDFTAAGSNGTAINGDLTVEMQQNQIAFVQSIWIDNRLAAQPFVITFLGFNYVIQVRAGRQGAYPVYGVSGDLRYTANSNGGIILVPTIMFNFLETPWWQDV